MRKESPGTSMLLIIPILLYTLGVSAYFVMRFNGQWNEGDTSRQIQVMEYVGSSNSLIMDSPGPVYQHGPTYPLLSVFLMKVTGISAQTLTIYVYPFTIALIALIGFAVYKTLTGSTIAALLATLFMYIQPDFLWVTLRGSHEKITWALVLLAFFLLGRSFTSRRKISTLMQYVGLFYLVTFALVSTNVFFASSFIAAVSLGFLGGWMVILLRERKKDIPGEDRSHIQRLFYIAISCSSLMYLFIFYIYPPARSGLETLHTMIERLAALLLNFDIQYNPYEYVVVTWPNPFTYFSLTAVNYVILLSSFIVWLRGIPRFLNLETLSDEHLPRLLLWLLYPAFAIQVAISAVIDLTGVVGGNLQVRLFTPLMLIAIPLTTLGITQVWAHLRMIKAHGIFTIIISLLVLWFGVASLLKMTNEPAISNQWIFHTQAEQQAGAWVMRHVKSARVWFGLDERLSSTMGTIFYPLDDIIVNGGSIRPGTRYYFISSFEKIRAGRLRYSMPYLGAENLVYDNSEVRIYQRRPRTPYQR